MPIRHGLIQEKDKPPAMLFGIGGIFWNLVDTAVNVSPQIDKETRDIRKRFFEESYMHFNEILHRFLDALDIFQQYMVELDASFSMENHDWLSHANTQRRAGMAADSALQYLGMLLDVVGSLIPFVILDKPMDYSCFSNDHKKICDSLQKTKKNANRNLLFAQLKDVFAQLDLPSSWWQIGYKPGNGMRQRITHYRDFVMFQGKGMVGEKTFKTQAILGNAVDLNDSVDFVKALKLMLAGLCDWLDELEQKLFEILQNRATCFGKVLTRRDATRLYLPIFKIEDPRKIPEKEFLYLPMCQGSGQLKTMITWRCG